MNLNAYYTLVKTQTQNSFIGSMVAAMLGFVLILLGLVISFQRGDENLVGSIIAVGSGIIIEFIAGVFFVLYNRTVRQLKGYHDSLIGVQNILLSFRVVEGMKDEVQKQQVAKDTVKYLLERQAI